MHRWRVVVFVGVAVVGAVLVARHFTTPSIDELLREADRAISLEDFEQAEVLAARVLSQNPSSPGALLVAGTAAEARRDFEQALTYYSRIDSEFVEQRLEALTRSGELRFNMLGQMSAAEQEFRNALAIDPSNTVAVDRLALLLRIEGRAWEAAPLLFQLVRQNQFTLEQLCWLGVFESITWDPQSLERCRSANPSDPLPMLGLAQLHIYQNDISAAKELLIEVVELEPEIVSAQAALGNILVDSGTDEELVRWHRKIPEAAEEDSTVWHVYGKWAQRMGNRNAAIRCFLEAVSMNPNDRLSNNQLAIELSSIDEQLAERFAQHTRQLIDYSVAVNAVRADSKNVDLMRVTAGLAESMGRLWEAWAWCQKALELNSRVEWANETARRLNSELTAATPQFIPESNPAYQVDLNRWPLPDWTEPDPSQNQIPATVVKECDVQFIDSTEAVGIEFQFRNGGDSSRKGTRVFEITGGGIAAFDFDSDGWPDIHFTQGCDWPPRPDQKRDLDQLYRNIDGHRFDRATRHCGIVENGFSQGLAAGDFNNDGFVDLYVANIGVNRLFQNNGDGTFSDVTADAGIEDSRWTSSCLVADLDGDALPEIYDVNYLKGDDLFDRVCKSPDGRVELCAPLEFIPEQDRLLRNLGDGSFKDRSTESGITADGGRGLGVVAANFDGANRLSLFVANDESRNFFFQNVGGENAAGDAKSSLRFEERGLRSGLAMGENGWNQACMGVAAGDINEDGLLDLFVTNYFNESNCLYVQQADCCFRDLSRQSGVREPGYGMLGFGTQFLDGELDGLPDVVVANGHIEDRTDQGIPYRMRPQYFQNRGLGEFVESAAGSPGQFFTKERLGRGLVRLDWNRDGLDDFAVSHLASPSSLVTNVTPSHGSFLTIRLRGTKSSRDAIGAEVTVTVGGRRLVRQLVAGDGYQASNQRQLIFGLGDAAAVESLQIRWPSGVEQTWSELPINAEFLLLESDNRLHRMTP